MRDMKAVGRIGGLVKSQAKSDAARENLKLASKQGGKKNAQPMSLASLCSVLGVPYHRTYFRVKHFDWPYSEAFREIAPPKTPPNAS